MPYRSVEREAAVGEALATLSVAVSLTCTLSETDGTQVGEAQITDDTYTEGYVGWMGWGNTADTKYYATYSIEEKR